MTDVVADNSQSLKSDVSESLASLPSGSSSKDVLEALSRMIEKNELTIGDRLPPEVEIARRLSISRAKVREALTSWQNMGIVVRNKKAGTRLAAEVMSNSIHLPVTVKLEAESLLRTHAVRKPLEIEAVRLAAENASDHHKKMITARVAELMSVYEAGEDWRPTDYRFHGALQDACGNPLFGQLIQLFVTDALPACVAMHQPDIACDPSRDPVQHGFAVCDFLADAQGCGPPAGRALS